MEPEPKEITFSQTLPSRNWVDKIYVLNAPYRHRQMDFSVKGTTHPKMKMCWKSIQLQAIKDVEFVSSSEQIQRNVHFTSLAHQWIICSELVPSEWAYKNITIFHK